MLNLLSCCRPQHVELRNAFCRFAWHRRLPRRVASHHCRAAFCWAVDIHILSFTHTGPKAEGHKLRLRTGRSRRKNRHFVIVKWENEQKKGKRKMNEKKGGRWREREREGEKKICSLCKLATGNRCKFLNVSIYSYNGLHSHTHAYKQTDTNTLGVEIFAPDTRLLVSSLAERFTSIPLTLNCSP